MRLIVDDLPRTPKECLFGWKHLEYSKWRCKFGGECELSAECRQCSHLATFATDTNVGTKLGTNLAEVGTDCISREQAIDALSELATFTDEWSEHTWMYTDDVYGAIMQLPPAQPERTCVNCGRTVNNGGWYADGGTRCPIEEHYALPKDGYCHLWEKRNVTDDDYPERREE